MKKVLMLIATATLLAAYTHAQTTFAIRAGVNFQNINGEEEDGTKLDNKMATKFHAGVQADFPLGTDFFFQPGLIFTTKGAKAEETFLGETLTSKINIGYIDIPLSLVYKPTVGAGRLILGFGPYVGIGITGKYKLEMGDMEEEQDIEFKNDVKSNDPDAAYVRRIDAGGNVFAGFEFSETIFLQLNAQLGLMNLNPKFEGQNPEGKSKHTGFGVSLGFNF